MKLPFSHFIISGHSMLPLYKPGDHVITFNWNHKFKSGEVVISKVFGKLIIKRIRKIQKDRYLLQGDNKTDSKEFGWVDKDKVVGKVILKYN